MSVTVEKLISDFELEVLVEGEKNVKISVNDINRPGLQLAGFYNYTFRIKTKIFINSFSH